MQQEAITQFKGQLRGELIEPTDTRYEEARKVYNAMISRKPRLIARCADVADVITAVQLRPGAEVCAFRSAAAATTPADWASVTMAWSSTSP